MGRAPRWSVGVLLVGLLAACGDDGGSAGEAEGEGAQAEATEGGPVTLDDLIERLPDSDLAASVDLVALREDLGLDPDDDLSDFDDDASRRGSVAAALAIPYLGSPRDDLAVQQAIDLGQIEAAASVPLSFAPEEAVVVMASGQDPDEIRGTYEDLGWEDVGDGIVADEDASVSRELYTAFGADDGLLVLGQDADLVAEVLAGPAEERSAAAEALDLVDGPARVATSNGGTDCGDTIAAAERLDGGGGGELVVSTGGDGSAELNLAEGDRFTDRNGVGEDGFWVVDSVTAEDGFVRLAWSYADDGSTLPTLSDYPLQGSELIASVGWLTDC